MSIKINALEFENVKRIKAVKMEPSPNGLTVIGGNNGQGKTSVLDAIAYALGGEKFRPSEVKREGSVTEPYFRVELSNGLIVERKGKKSALKVTDPEGRQAGQQLLDSFIEKLALNLPKFMDASGKEKADVLLKIIGVGDELSRLEKQEKDLYNERLYVGRTADQKEKYAKEMPYFEGVPDEPVSPTELIRQQQEILARNGQREYWKREYDSILNEMDILERKIKEYKEVVRRSEEQYRELQTKAAAAQKTPAELKMESTVELEESISNIDETNRKVRANLDKEKAEGDAKLIRDQYSKLTEDIEAVRKAKTDLLSKADLPLPELSVEDGELIFKGQKWDNMSGSDRLIVATSIVRKLNPECSFVLMDKLEQMDLNTLDRFNSWLQEQNLQVIATRVSTGDECSVIIEDGYIAQEKVPDPVVIDWGAIDF